MEVLIPFIGSPVIGPNDKVIKDCNNHTFDYFYQSGCNVTYQNPKSPHVFAIHSKVKEENSFGLHVYPNLVYVHLPARCGGKRPIKEATPMDQMIVDQLAGLLGWAVNID